jgi:hypothetical protein
MTDDSDLLCLVYLSRAVRPMTDADLIGLLRQCRANNVAAGVSGLLLYRDGRFMQALEGPRAAVMDLYARVMRDPRHTEVTSLIKFKAQDRGFADWAMGFANVDLVPEADRAGYSPFLQQDFSPAVWMAAPHQAIRLLEAFREAGRDLVEV